jgi:hypothetical protein
MSAGFNRYKDITGLPKNRKVERRRYLSAFYFFGDRQDDSDV